MNELLLEIVRLEEQESEIAAKLQRMDSIEPEYQRMEEELNSIGRVIASKKSDVNLLQERQQAIEQKVETEDVPFSVLGASLEGVPAPVIKLIEKVVKADRKRIYNEHAVELEQIEDGRDAYIAEAELKISNQDKAIEALRSDYESCARELQEQTAETLRLIEERNDFKSKLANAAVQLDEKDAEIARLNDQIDEYQKAKVWGERQQQQIIDIDSESVNEIEAAAAEVKKLYTAIEDWGSVQKVYKPDGSFDLVKRSELEQWEPLNPPLVEPVLPFQGEAATTQLSDNPVPTPEATTEVGPQFQTETGPEMAVPTSGVEDAVSREEFETLKNDVEALKRKAGWAA